MTIALVGAVGAVSTGAAGSAVTPAWGTGETRAAGNLLVLWVSVTGSATTPGTPAGWTLQYSNPGTSCSANIFTKVAAGADTAPTVPAVTSGTINAQLAEFSGAGARSKVGNAAGITSPLVATAASADSATGALFLSAAVLVNSSARTNAAWNQTFNNGAADVETANAATSTVSHYGFSYGYTTTNAAADSDSFAFTTTSVTGASVVICSFNPAPPPTYGTYATGVLALTPLAYWRLGEGSRVTAADTSGNGHTGTYSATGVTYAVGSLLNSDPGDTAVTLNGSTGTMSAVWAGVADTFTLEAWVKPVLTTPQGCIIGGNTGHGALYMSAGGGLIGNSGGVATSCTSTGLTMAANTAHHVVWTKNGAANHLYCDGVDVTGSVTNQTCTTASPVTVGSVLASNYDFFNGTVDEAAVYGFALTPTQVAQNYANGITAPGVTATGTGAIAFAGSGAATVTVTGVGSGAVSFAGGGAATWTPPITATSGTGAIAFAGAGVAKVTVNGTGSGAVTFAGAGTAVYGNQVPASGSGAVTFAGAGVATWAPLVVTATGTGAVIFTGAGIATFLAPVFTPTGTGPLAFAGAGVASFTGFSAASGSGAIAFAGAGVAKLTLKPTGTGQVAFAGSGSAGSVVTVTAVGTGAINFAGHGATLGAVTGVVSVDVVVALDQPARLVVGVAPLAELVVAAAPLAELVVAAAVFDD